MHGDRGNGMTQIVTMVIIIGVLGNGLFGAGMRAVQERETNVLRRYKVTPITPAPILIAATVVGWIFLCPWCVFMFCVAHFGYGMPWPPEAGIDSLVRDTGHSGLSRDRNDSRGRGEFHAGKPDPGAIGLPADAVLERRYVSDFDVSFLAAHRDAILCQPPTWFRDSKE